MADLFVANEFQNVCERLTTLLAQGKNMPRENTPSRGPPIIPNRERAAWGSIDNSKTNSSNMRERQTDRVCVRERERERERETERQTDRRGGGGSREQSKGTCLC